MFTLVECAAKSKLLLRVLKSKKEWGADFR